MAFELSRHLKVITSGSIRELLKVTVAGRLTYTYNVYRFDRGTRI